MARPANGGAPSTDECGPHKAARKDTLGFSQGCFIAALGVVGFMGAWYFDRHKHHKKSKGSKSKGSPINARVKQDH